MDTTTTAILASICIFILLIMLINASRKPTATISATKVVTTQPNNYVAHNVPNYHPGYNPYKAQYYN